MALDYERVPLHEGLRRGRSHLVFLAGLAAAMALIVALEGIAPSGPAPAPSPAPVVLGRTDSLRTPHRRPLTAPERAWARTAWAYFETAGDSGAALPPSVAGGTTTTLWDAGATLMALVSAERLGLIDRRTFDARVRSALEALRGLRLTRSGLPDRTFAVGPGGASDPGTAPGYRAVDFARLAAAFRVLAWRYPEHTAAIRVILARWRLDGLVRNGVLYGATADGSGRMRGQQEGRLGYEQYAAAALGGLGLDAGAAADARHLRLVDLEGVEVPVDARQDGDALPPSEPLQLLAFAFGAPGTMREVTARVYAAQAWGARQATSVAAGAAEPAVGPWDGPGRPDADSTRLLRTGVAFGWWALFRTPYARRLVTAVERLATPSGWRAGLSAPDGRPVEAVTCATNAHVLEALAFITTGPLADPVFYVQR